MRFSRLIRIGLVVTVLASSFNPAYADDKRRAAEAFKRVERVLIDEGVSLGRYREEEPPKLDEQKRQKTIKWAEDTIKKLANLQADKQDEVLKSGLNKTWGETYVSRQKITEEGIAELTDPAIVQAYTKFKDENNYIGLTLVYLLVSAMDNDNYEAVGKKLEEMRGILDNVVAEFIPPVKKPLAEEVKKVVPTKIDRKWLLEDLERLGGSEDLFGKRMEKTKSLMLEYLSKKITHLEERIRKEMTKPDLNPNQKKAYQDYLTELDQTKKNAEKLVASDYTPTMDEIRSINNALTKVVKQFFGGNEEGARTFVLLTPKLIDEFTAFENGLKELKTRLKDGTYQKMDLGELQAARDKIMGSYRFGLASDETMENLKEQAEKNAKRITKFMKGDGKNPSYYYITQTWLDGLKLTINQFQREAEKGFGWLYYSYLDADIDMDNLNSKYLDIRSSYNRFSLFYASVFSKAQFSDQELADIMGLDLSKTSDKETLAKIREVIPVGETTGAARGEAIIQLIGNMRTVVKHIIEKHGEDFAKRFMAQFYSPWHSEFLSKNKLEATNTYEDFFTALEVLASGPVLRNVLAKELQVLEVLQRLPAIEFGLNKDQKKTYPTYEVAAKFSSLSLDAKYQIMEMFRKEYGDDWEKRMDVSKDWGRFAVVVEYANKLPKPFAPYLFSEIGDQLMKTHPYNMDVMLQLITSASNVFYKINDFEGITTYYAALPHKMDKIFVDIFDIKDVTKRGAKTTQPFGAVSLQEEDQIEGLGRLMMDSMPKDIRIIPPSDATGDYAYIYSPSVGVIIRIPRQVYNSFSTVDLYGTATSVSPDVLRSPAGSPSILGIPKQWFEQGLVDVFVSRPTPQMYPFFSINKLYLLMPDQLPRVGEFTSFMENYNMVYNSTSSVTEKDATHPEFETGQQIPVTVRETTGASAQTHVFSGTTSGGGKEIISDVSVSKAKTEPTVMTLTPKDKGKRLESITTNEAGDVIRIEGVDQKEIKVSEGDESIDYSGTATIRNLPGVIENGSLLVGHGTFQGNQDRLERLQIFLNEIAPEGNDTVLYFDRTYRENTDGEKVPYYRVYSFKRFKGGHIAEVDYTDLSKEEAESTYGMLFNKEDEIARRVHKGYARTKVVGGGFELELEGAFLMVETKSKEGEGEPEITDKEFQGVGGAAQIGRFGAFTLYEHTRGKHLAIGIGDFDKEKKNFTVGRFFWSKEEDKMETDFWLYRADELEAKGFLAQKDWESFAGAGLFHYVSTGFRTGGAILGKSSALGTEGETAGQDMYGGHFYLTDPNYGNALVLSALWQKSGGRADFLAGAAGEAVLGALNLKAGTRFDIKDVKGDPDYEGKNFAQVVYTPEGETIVQSLVANGVYIDIEDKKAGLIGGGGDFYVDAEKDKTAGGELYYLSRTGAAGELRYRSPTFDAVVGGSLKSDIAPYSLWTGARVKWRGGESYGVFTYTQEEADDEQLKGDEIRTYQGALGVSFSIVPDYVSLDQYATVWTLTTGMPFMVQTLGDNLARQIDPQFALTVSGDKHQGALLLGMQHWRSDLVDEGIEDTRTRVYVTGSYTTTAIPWWDTTTMSLTFFANLQDRLTSEELSKTGFSAKGTGLQFVIRADGF